MELGILLAIAFSALAGLALRRRTGRGFNRCALATAMTSLGASLVLFVLAASGVGPLSTFASAIWASGLFALGAIALPFALLVAWKRGD